MADTSKINDWLQVVGMFGVIASLIFVGLQMKQAHEIALSDTYQSRSNGSVDAMMATTGSPELLVAISKVYAGRSEELEMPEAVALEHYLGANVTMFENNHRQLELGFLSEEHWQRNLTELRCTLAPPLLREMILSWHYREPFMNLMREIVDDIDESEIDCWSGSWRNSIQY